MHDCPEKVKEVERLADVQKKLKDALGVVTEHRKKYKITGV